MESKALQYAERYGLFIIKITETSLVYKDLQGQVWVKDFVNNTNTRISKGESK